jgi:DNA-directed RNA polymerase I subunit RPA1
MDKTDDVDSSITNTINSYIDICMQKAYDSTVYNDRDNLLAKTKHIVDNRKMLIQQFFRSMGSKCPHCKAPVRKIRHEFQNKVILRGMSAKQAGQWVAAANAEKMKRETIEDKIKREEDEEDNMTDVKLKLYNTKMCTEHQYFTPIEAKTHLQQIWDNDPSLMMAICSCLRINEIEDHSINVEGCGSSPPTDMFFVDIIPVPPSRFRPISSMGEKKYESSQTTNLQKILKDCNDIQELLAEKNKPDEIIEIEDDTVKDPKRRPKQTLNERLRFSWSSLQTDVNTYMDSDINKKIKDLPNGIKQILEKKEGLFRKNMMGKRVNYAARSVISPDPNINMDEIGIPMVFATSLTYPEPVTHWNVHELKQAVINGPNIYPGATHVQNEDGSLILLNPRNSLQRRGLANRLLAPNKLDSIQGTIKIVYRHLKNKDVLLLNRQPTLHKPSIMAHLVRVLPGEMTIRLHYANCKAYNADFDGDEMNIHFPQNELSRSEAYHLGKKE